MNSVRPLLLSLALLAPAFASAQSTAPGQVRSYIVKGNVELVDESTGSAVPLRPGRIFSHGFSVRSGANSRASLVLSTGSTVMLEPNSNLTFAQFQQSPFPANLGSFHTLSADPSQSAVALNLNSGTLNGRVKKLHAASTFDIQTPMGRVSVHGTTFSIGVGTDSFGNAVVTVTNVDGGVTFFPLEGVATTIAEGTVISVRLDQEGMAPVAVIYNTQRLSEAEVQAILDLVGSALGDDPALVESPVFIPVEVDPSVVSPEGGE